MANVQLEGGYMPLPINIRRGNPIPLDSTSVHYPTFTDGEVTKSAYENAVDYAKNSPVAYVGQIITICEGMLVEGSFVVNRSSAESGVYYIADREGTLVKLVNNEIYNDDKKEDLEVDYDKIVITKTEGVFTSAIIMAPRNFKVKTSDLFINGIKYNNTEYTEILVEGETDICDRIEFTAFEIIPQNKEGVGDEITIMADYE